MHSAVYIKAYSTNVAMYLKIASSAENGNYGVHENTKPLVFSTIVNN